MKTAINFGKYLLLDRINVGGMAEVFLAKAFGVEGFERLLAIKRILPNMADDDEFINMFVDEARIAVQLQHANVVQIYELGKYESQYYIAMEYVSGKDLRQVLDVFRKKQEVLPLPAAAFVTAKICEGLDYAHHKTDPSGRPLNLIHRDVSPQNILVSFEGAVKVTDFGIAKAEDRASKTQAGVLKGKFGYMSPEQVRGLDIDQRSDIFAVGILLYEMVTGKRLFIGESDFSTLEKVRNAEVIPPTQINPNIPEALEQVMLKALAKERDERYHFAADMADDLQQFLIEDNTIFNAKRLAALLGEHFGDDIAKERTRLEDAMRVQPPSIESFSSAAMEMSSATPAHGVDVRAEKTMIFESAGFADGDAATAATQIAIEASRAGATATQGLDTTGVSVASASAVRSAGAGGSQAGRAPVRRHVGAIIVGVTALISLAVLLAVLLTGPGAELGTIVITSAPVDAVQVYLDGKLLGERTPITRGDVPVGEHVLVARSQGFADRAYKFELLAAAPAVINVELEKGVSGSIAIAQGEKPSPDASEPGATILVQSEPPGAKVKLGGLPRGETPVGLQTIDVSSPLVFEVSKDGFKTQTVTVTLAPNETKKTVVVKLVPLAPQKSKLVVRSEPTGALVFSGSNKLGTTPLEVPDLDATQTYELRLEKDGYRSFTTTAAMAGKPEVVVNATLEREKKPSGGGHKGGGGCSGSGAKMSVSAGGEPDCKVQVGRTSLGVAPFLNKDAPVGRCDVRVVCPSGKKYAASLTLKSGGSEKLIIKPDMWR